MSMRFKGGIISATPPTPNIYSAPGAWTLQQQMQAQAASAWPSQGSIPSNAWIAYGTISGLNSDWTQTQNIIFDVYGNVFASGYYNTGSANNVLFAKYNSSGVIQWAKSLSTVSNKSSLGSDSSGNIYVSGNGTGAAIEIAKYNYVGTIQWQKYIDYSSVQTVFYASAVDSSGNSYVAGYSNGGASLYLAKIDSSGTLSFDRKLTGGSGGNYTGVQLDSSGNIYASGTVSISNAQYAIAKYDSSGTIQWQKKVDSANPSYANGMTVDSSGNSYIVGQEYNGGSNCGILIKLNSSGAISWQKRLRDSGLQDISFSGVTVDSSGNVYVTGYAKYPYSVIIVKYDSSGSLQWQRTMTLSGSQNSFGHGITCDTVGNLYINGNLGLSQTNNFVFKLPSDGSATGTYGSGTTFTYASSSFSDLTPSFTASNLSWTAATPGLSTVTSAYTDASQTIATTNITVV